jgi:Fur family transcriptional regulator, ferric uptake regulator
VARSEKTPARRRIEAIESACRDRGLRMTGQRRVIAQVLGEAEDHPDVVELHRRAAAVDDRISLSTVYRTLKLFESEGIIERLEFLGGRSRYERVPQEHHDHLINLDTGDVLEFRSEEIEALQTEIARRLGFRLVSHRLELYAVPLNGKNAKRR